MKNYLLNLSKQNVQIITRMMIMLVAFGFFGMSAYGQISGTTPATRCGEGTIVLGATGAGIITWYDVPFYGTALATGGSYTTAPLSNTTTYYVDALDASGCSLNTSPNGRRAVVATVSASSIQASIFYASNAFCKSIVGEQTVTRTGTAGGTYTIVPSGLTINSSTGAITPSSSTIGTYTVTYTITVPALGCTENPASTNVIITTAPVAPAISYSGSPYCTSAGQALVTQTGATGGTYSAAPSGLSIHPTSGTITPSSSSTGNYTITYFVTGSGGCDPQTATTTISVLQLPTASVSYAGPFTKNQETQPVALTGTGVYTGGVYSSTSGLTIDGPTGTITPASSTAGTYTVSYALAAVSPCAAPVVATTTVTIYPLPSATISGTTSVCRNSDAPDITFTGTGGTEPYTFTYYIGAGSGQTITTTSVTVSQPTVLIGSFIYTLTNVTDAHGSSQAVAGQTATITVTNLQVATFAYTASPYCSVGTDPLPTMLEGGVKGTFSSTSGLVFLSTSTGEIDLSASTAGAYTVTNTIAAAGGCDIVTATANITITKLPVATFSYVGSPYCSNAGPQTATLGGGASAGVFTSTPGLVFLNTANGQVDLAGSIAGTYTVTNTVAATNGCGLVSATNSIQIDNAVTVGATYFDYGTIFTRCQAAGTVTFHAAAENATSIVYTLDATTAGHSGNSINASTGEVTFAANWVGTGSTVTATSTAHCANTTTASITINTNPVVVVGPTIFTLGTTSSRCQGAGTVTYAATATNSNSITYQLDAASVAAGNSISQFTGEVSYVAGWFGTSTIDASATVNCGNTTTNTHTVTTYPTTVGGSIAGSVYVCTGANSTDLTLSGETGDVVKWQYSSSATFSSDINDVSNTTTSLTASNLTATTYYRAQIKSGDCSAAFSDIATITVVLDPSIGTQPTSPATICVGGTSANMTIVAANGTPSLTYQWQYYNGSSWANVANATPSGATYTGATATTFSVAGITGAGTYQYKCIVSASGTGCGDATSDAVTVTVVADPSISTQPTSPASICVGGTSANITIVAANGTPSFTYQWQYYNGSSWANVANATPAGATYTGATAATFAVVGISSAGAYQYKCIVSASGNGCGDVISDAVTLTVVADPTIATQPAATTTICQGGSASLSVVATNGTGTFTYSWKNFTGNWTNVVNGIPAGAIYTGESTATLTVSGITGTYANLWYKCVVSSSGTGCDPVTSTDANVPVMPIPTWSTISTPTPTTLCVGGTVAFSANISYGAGGTISWIRSATSGGSGTTVTTGDAPGVGTWYYRPHYEPTGSGCNLADGTETTVVVSPLPTITSTGTAASVTYSASSQTTTMPYTATTNSPNSYSINWDAAANTAGLADQGSTSLAFASGEGSVTGIVVTAITVSDRAGTFTGTMTITTANGCTATQAVSLTINPVAPTGTSPQTFCSGN